MRHKFPILDFYCDTAWLMTDALSRAGFSGGQIEKICWENAMRVLKEAL